MSVAVVIPLDRATLDLTGDKYRQRAYAYVNRHVAALHQPIVVGVSEGDWCKATAVGDALTRTDADVIVVHDADVVVPIGAVQAAIDVVKYGTVEWAIPHRLVHRLDDETTKVMLKTGLVPRERMLVRWPYVGMAGGGVVVLRRSVYDDCPLDPRFLGWGSEDQSWGFALETLHGAPWPRRG